MSVIFCTNVCVSSTGAGAATLERLPSEGLLCAASCTAAASGGGVVPTACCRVPFRIAMAATTATTTNSVKMTTFGRIDCSDVCVQNHAAQGLALGPALGCAVNSNR